VIKIFTLTRNEQEIVELMWAQNRPLTRTEIIDLSPDKSWKPASIHILLNKLLDKEAIVVSGFVKTGKSFGRTYSPSVSCEEYDKMQIKHYFKKRKLSIGELVAALLDDEVLDDTVIKELEDIIKKRKEKAK